MGLALFSTSRILNRYVRVRLFSRATTCPNVAAGVAEPSPSFCSFLAASSAISGGPDASLPPAKLFIKGSFSNAIACVMLYFEVFPLPQRSPQPLVPISLSRLVGRRSLGNVLFSCGDCCRRSTPPRRAGAVRAECRLQRVSRSIQGLRRAPSIPRPPSAAPAVASAWGGRPQAQSSKLLSKSIEPSGENRGAGVPVLGLLGRLAGARSIPRGGLWPPASLAHRTDPLLDAPRRNVRPLFLSISSR